MSLLLENYTNMLDPNSIVLTEAYYGKSKYLKEIESKLDKLIDDVKNEKDTSYNDNIYEIEKLFKKQFGVDEFILNIYNGLNLNLMNIKKGTGILKGDPGAYPLIGGFNYFKNRKEDGKKELKIGVNITSDFLTHYNLTGEELTGIILHEIGHNMDSSLFTLISQSFPDFSIFEETGTKPDPKVYLISTIFKAFINAINTYIISGANFSLTWRYIQSFIEKIPGLKWVINKSNMIVRELLSLKQLRSFYRFISGTFKTNHMYVILKSLSPRQLFGYSSEQYADSFATAYGYGPALSSAFGKINQTPISNIEKGIKRIPGVNCVYDLLKLQNQLIGSMMKPHPSDPARIAKQLNKLKKEVKDPNIDERIRKDIEEDIKRLEDYIENEFLNIRTDENKRAIFTYMYNKVVIDVFKGKIDPRELLNLISNNEE